MQQNWHHAPGHREQLFDYVLSPITAVNLHDDALVDGLALTSKTRREHKVGAILLLHGEQLICDRFQLLDGATASLNVEVIVVALLFYPVKTFFELVLAVSNETGVFRGPCWMRSPFVVQDRLAQLVTATAYPLTLAFR